MFKKKEANAITKFKDSKDELIKYVELEKIKLNEVQQIKEDLPGAIECIRITSPNPDSLMFTVTMKKDQLWEKHHHDCDEVCVVYKGKLKDINSGLTAGPIEMLKIKAYKSHYIIAEEDTIFYVEFKKPKE